MSPRVRSASCAALLAIAALASVARADDGAAPDAPHEAIAQSLFDDARALMDAGRYAEACPKLAESERLDPAGGTLLNLAVCHELEGKTATAWQELKDARSQAVRDGRKDRVALADEHLAAVEPRLVRVAIVVPASVGARAPSVTLDGVEVPRAAWSSAIPIDPGAHAVVVAIAGAEPWRHPFDAAAGAGATATIEVDVPPSYGVLVPLPPPLPARRARSTAFWITGGAGAALLAASAVTGIVALGAASYVRDNCDANRSFCRVPDAADAATRAKTFAWISTGALALGAAALATAFFLPRAREPRPRPAASR